MDTVGGKGKGKRKETGGNGGQGACSTPSPSLNASFSGRHIGIRFHTGDNTRPAAWRQSPPAPAHRLQPPTIHPSSRNSLSRFPACPARLFVHGLLTRAAFLTSGNGSLSASSCHVSNAFA